MVDQSQGKGTITIPRTRIITKVKILMLEFSEIKWSNCSIQQLRLQSCKAEG